MQRIGRRNQPAYRVVVIQTTRGPKSGKFIERIGHYNPLIKDRVFNKDRLHYWMGQGALLSDTVHNFCISDGIVEGKKKNALSKHRAITKEESTTPPMKPPTDTDSIPSDKQSTTPTSTDGQPVSAKEESQKEPTDVSATESPPKEV